MATGASVGRSGAGSLPQPTASRTATATVASTRFLKSSSALTIPAYASLFSRCHSTGDRARQTVHQLPHLGYLSSQYPLYRKSRFRHLADIRPLPTLVTPPNYGALSDPNAYSTSRPTCTRDKTDSWSCPFPGPPSSASSPVGPSSTESTGHRHAIPLYPEILQISARQVQSMVI